MLKRRKKHDTYLAADSRHRQSSQIAMKVDKVCSFQPAFISWGRCLTSRFPLAAPANTEVSLPLQLMKAAVPAQSYTLYPVSSRSANSSDVYCQQPGRCRSLSFFLFNIVFYLMIKKGICDRQNISSFHVFVCVFHPEISSFFSKTFPFLFLFIVIFCLFMPFKNLIPFLDIHSRPI
jgi:hypothetical protein